jgi:hypothetical protein
VPFPVLWKVLERHGGNMAVAYRKIDQYTSCREQRWWSCQRPAFVAQKMDGLREGSAKGRQWLGGALQTGRVLDYRDKGDENRKLCSRA